MHDYCYACDCEANHKVEGHCKKCVNNYLVTFREELRDFLEEYEDAELVAKGPNLILRHKTGEEIYF